MKQKLMAVAVAGALAVPGFAAAQVTISGSMGVGLTQGKIYNRAVTQTTSSFIETDMAIRFAMVEDLGGGTQFYGQYEFRPVLDGATDPATGGDALAVGSTSPPAFVGLRNKGWGSVRAGIISVWGSRGGVSGPEAYHYSGARFTDYVQGAGANATSIVSGRQRNVIVYQAPDMGAFNLIGAYSTSSTTNDADMTVATRKGNAWFLAPEFNAGFAKIGLVHADIKVDASTQYYKGDKLYITGSVAGFNTGLIMSRWKGGTAVAENIRQTGWYWPISYKMANHTFGIILGKARDNTAIAGDQSAKYRGAAYNYAFSRRTSMSVSYNKMDNGANAAFDLTGATGPTDGTLGFTTAQGEDQSAISVALHHSF